MGSQELVLHLSFIHTLNLANFCYGDEIPNLITCKKFLVRLKKQGFELLDFVVNGMLEDTSQQFKNI